MKIEAKNILLFIEPTSTEEPIDDELTRKIEKTLDDPMEHNIIVGSVIKKGFAVISKGMRTLGTHQCICGVRSESADYGIQIGGGVMYTNSLAAHYVKFHRSSVSKRDLDLIAALPE